MSNPAVNGIWLTKSSSDLGNKIEVLVELEDGWHRVIEEVADDGPISHIVEPAGIKKAPLVDDNE